MLKTLTIAALSWLIPICATAIGATSEVPVDCAAYVPFGLPITTAEHPTTLACRIGYLSQVDGDTLQPDWVAWTLDAHRALGCTARTNPFHYDNKLPSGFVSTPGDYSKSGYDLGHMMSAMDSAVSPEMEYESFDVPTNFSPQVPGLNRQGFEELEANSRAWALQFGKLDIADGPIFTINAKTIGAHKVSVPTAYWKVVYSEAKHQAVAIIMQNEPTPKGHLSAYVVSINEAEMASGVHLSLPPDVDRVHAVLPWPADTAGFTKAKKAACAH